MSLDLPVRRDTGSSSDQLLSMVIDASLLGEVSVAFEEDFGVPQSEIDITHIIQYKSTQIKKVSKD